jgi:hypothetical protein
MRLLFYFYLQLDRGIRDMWTTRPVMFFFVFALIFGCIQIWSEFFMDGFPYKAGLGSLVVGGKV